MAEERIVVRNAEGNSVVALLWRHPTSTDVALVCHGMFSNSSNALVVAVACSLSADMCACRLDFSGNGCSGGEWRYAGYQREVADIAAVRAELESRGLALRVLCGHSKGGTAVSLYAADHDVPLLVGLASRLAFGPETRFTEAELAECREKGSVGWQKYGRVWRITQESLDERRVLAGQMQAALRRIRAKVLHVHGTADDMVTPAQAQFLCDAQPSTTVEWIEGAGHSFSGHEVATTAAIREWVRNNTPRP
eukprot:m51a1_g3346 putative alpha beta-hydrolase domain-containing protein (251) ;mRNA; r:405270-406022